MELLNQGNEPFGKLKEELREGRAERKRVNSVAEVVHQRLRLHTDIVADTAYCRDHQRGRDLFLDWVSGMLDPLKYETFKGFFRPPYPTNPILAWVKKERSRCFRASDRNVDDFFKDDATKEDADAFALRINLDSFIRTTAFNRLDSSPNDYIFFEYEQEESDLKYPYFKPCIIPVSACLFYCAGEYFGFLVEEDSKMYVHACDAENFYRCELNGSEITGEVVTIPHGLGFVPAMQLSDMPINSTDDRVMANDIYPYVAELDWYIYEKLSKRNVDNYASHPLIETFKKQCDYKTELGIACQDGFIFVPDAGYGNTSVGPDNLPVDFDAHTNANYSSGYNRMRCPKCSGKHSGLMGAGTVIQKPVPIDKDSPDLSNALQFITPDDKILQYTLDKNSQEEARLKEMLAGWADMRDVAKNEAQIKNNTESRKSILMQVSERMQRIEKFVRTAVFSLRYGKKYIRSVVNYGTDWLLKDANTVTEDYKTAQEGGLPVSELALRYDTLAKTEYGTEEKALAKARIMVQLEPYANTTMKDVIELAKIGIISQEEVNLKANLNKYVALLEREFGQDIVTMHQLQFNGHTAAMQDRLMALVPKAAEKQPLTQP